MDPIPPLEPLPNANVPSVEIVLDPAAALLSVPDPDIVNVSDPMVPDVLTSDATTDAVPV